MFSDFDINNAPVSYSFLGFGDMVTSNTVNKIKDTIKVSSKNLRVRNTAANIVAHLKAKDQWAEVDEVYWWVKNHTRYLKDPHGTEMIHSPIVALDQIESGVQFQGDCDDLTVLTLSLLKSIGYPVALRIAAYKPDKTFQHVYGLVNIFGEWIPIEPIAYDKLLGWESPNATNIKDYRI